MKVGTLIGRALLLRDPKKLEFRLAQSWDKFADDLRERIESAEQALQLLEMVAL